MRTLRVGLAVAAAFAVAGCGGDDGDGGDDGPLTKAQLSKQASAICKDYAEQGEDLGQPDFADPESAKAYFDKAADLARQQQDGLSGLEPGDAEQENFDKLVTASGAAVGVLEDLGAAVADNDREGIAELIQDLTNVSQDLDEAANAVGANACASAGP